MAKVYLSLGSNIDADQHVAQALTELEQAFGALVQSPIYESEAVGFEGDNFLNLVVVVDTELPVGELSTKLRDIENQLGRDRTAPRFSSRTMDIDILLYGDTVGEIDGVQLPRKEILKNAFVLCPLADVAPDLLHPERKLSYRELWLAYDKTDQRLWPID